MCELEDRRPAGAVAATGGGYVLETDTTHYPVGDTTGSSTCSTATATFRRCARPTCSTDSSMSPARLRTSEQDRRQPPHPLLRNMAFSTAVARRSANCEPVRPNAAEAFDLGCRQRPCESDFDTGFSARLN